VRSGRATAHGDWVRWLKFNAVGAVGICLQLAVLVSLRARLHLHYLLATALAVEATVLHNFFWHERFTWADRKTTDWPSRLLKFNLATGLFSIAGNLFFTAAMVRAGLSYVPANAVSIALCSLINFFLNDRLVFVPPERRNDKKLKSLLGSSSGSSPKVPTLQI